MYAFLHIPQIIFGWMLDIFVCGWVSGFSRTSQTVYKQRYYFYEQGKPRVVYNRQRELRFSATTLRPDRHLLWYFRNDSG